MDFSNNAFRTPTSASKVSDDTMSHTNMVMACRWGWTSPPDPNVEGANASLTTASIPQPISTSTINNVHARRFAPCQGRLYHQLLCSHRIRTDLVEDCGANCVEPYNHPALDPAFFCHECTNAEASRIWTIRESQHNSMYPPPETMTKEQYDQWYQEHRQLETEFSLDQTVCELELKAKLRPSNICSAQEASKEEIAFASELDSLSLSLMASTTSSIDQTTASQARGRTNLPNDPSELLHWDLNTLALDRGSCGVEHSVSQLANGVPALRQMNEEFFWRKPRDR